MRRGATLAGLRRDRRGATALEYGLIACLVVVACAGAITTFASRTVAIWTFLNDTIGAALS